MKLNEEEFLKKTDHWVSNWGWASTVAEMGSFLELRRGVV